MNESPTPTNSYDEIVWPDKPALRDPELWAANCEVVKLLCDTAQVTEWCENDTFPKVPYKYDVQGVEIQFLPHWGFYSVGGIDLYQPTSAQDIQHDVQAARYLMSRGHKPKQS